MHSLRMTRRAPVDPIHLARPLAFAELATWGIRRSRVRSADVAHPFHSVHVIGGVPSGLRERCEALLPVMRPVDAFSHVTAAALLGAPLPRLRDSRLHVLSVGSVRLQRPGVAGHRAAVAAPRTALGILPIVAPAHVWVQLAAELGHGDLVAVGDYLVTPRRRAGLPAISSIEQLSAAIPARARGAGRARAALPDVRVGAESRMESLLRLLLIRAGLPEPLINPPMAIGGETLHPDLAYPQWRVVLEYEGDGHRTDQKQCAATSPVASSSRMRGTG